MFFSFLKNVLKRSHKILILTRPLIAQRESQELKLAAIGLNSTRIPMVNIFCIEKYIKINVYFASPSLLLMCLGNGGFYIIYLACKLMLQQVARSYVQHLAFRWHLHCHHMKQLTKISFHIWSKCTFNRLQETY